MHMGPLQQRPGHPAAHQSHSPASPSLPTTQQPTAKREKSPSPQKIIPRTQIMPVRSNSPALVASLPFSQPPAPTLLMSPPLAVSLDLCFTVPLKHPCYHHHMPLSHFSARAGIGRENVHSTAVGPLSGPFEVMGISYIPPPQSSLSSQVLETCLFPHQRDGRQAWGPGQPATRGHTASPAGKPRSLTSSAQQRPLKFRSCSDVAKMWHLLHL